MADKDLSLVQENASSEFVNVVVTPTANYTVTFDSSKNPIVTNMIQVNHASSSVGFFGTAPTTKPTALTAADPTVIDSTYGADEEGVLNNVRTRLGELETKLQALGLLA